MSVRGKPYIVPKDDPLGKIYQVYDGWGHWRGDYGNWQNANNRRLEIERQYDEDEFREFKRLRG